MLFRLFKKKKPIAIETTPTGSEPLANDYIPDQNEIRAAALVKRFGFDFDNLPHDTIRELLQEELSHPQEGSCEYLRVLCGYLYGIGDTADLSLIEKAKFSVSFDAQCMIDTEWIESLKNGGKKKKHVRCRADIIEDFVSYYTDYIS